MNRRGRSTGRRVAGLVMAVALAASALSSCSSPSADAPVDSLGAQFADLGIATVPFTGGDPVYPVQGDTVLTLTDWQVTSIAAATPDAATRADAPRMWSGVPTAALDAIADDLPPITGAEDLTPSAVIMAWWRLAESSRAAAARDLVAAPAGTTPETIPTAVLALFVADALGDSGRIVDPSQAMGDPETLVLALGADGGAPVAEPGPCEAVSSAIGSVNEYLESMGEIGTVIRGAITDAIGAIDTATGGVISAIKRVIGVANLVLNTASLLTPWNVSLGIDPASGQVVAFDKTGSPGTTSTVTVTIDGVAATPPAAVQGCLGLLGIVDPTSQEGSALTWTSYDGFVDRVSPSSIVPPADGGPSTIGADNSASMTVTTGTESSDAKKHAPALDTTPSITVYLERADVQKLTAWIRSYDDAVVQSVLGGTLESIATAVELAANPNATTLAVPVGYWVPDETPDPDPSAAPADPPTADDPPAPPGPVDVDACTRYRVVEDLANVTVTRVEYGEWEGMTNPIVPGEKIQACKYYVGTSGAMIVIEEPFFISNADAATDAAFTGLLAERGCSLASGLVDTGSDVTSYLVYSGNTLAGTFLYRLDVGKPTKTLRSLARAAGLC